MASYAAIYQVRTLIADLGTSPLLEDHQLEAFLALNGDAPLLAAAQALEVIAVSEVLVGKVIRTQDLQTDGAKVSAELRALAKSYREQHAANLAAADVFDGFDVADTLPAPSGSRPELTPWPFVTGM